MFPFRELFQNSKAARQRIVLKLINELKVKALWFGYPLPSEFFIDINNKLGKVFPSMYDFLNYCQDNNLQEITFNDFYKSLSLNNEQFFEKQFNGMSAYIFRTNRGVWKGNDKVQNISTVKELLNIYWNEKRMSISPQNNYVMFENKGQKDNDGNIILNKRKDFFKPDENGSFANCKN